MIPILYAGTEQSFISNGLGRLSDAISCKVTEERNGIFELEMTYPITGIHYGDIALNCIILAKTEEGGTNQAFIIYSISRPLNGIVTINANHISYLLNGIVVMPYEASSLADAMSKINTNAVIENPFTFTTDVVSSISFSFDTPRSIRSLLGGEQGSLLDVYGGYDYRFNNFAVSLLADRGNDNAVTLRYGKNITELKNLQNTTNVYTGIVPYWKSETEEVYLPEKVVLSNHASDYPYKIIRAVDFSSDFEQAPSADQLRAKAQSYIQNNKGWQLKNNIDVSFVALWQTEEYKEVAALERVKLCDTVRVVYTKLGVDIKTKVIKTVYNVLLDRYDSISLGDSTYSLSQAISSAVVDPEMIKNQSFTRDAVARATKLIQGGLGGHVVFNTNANGEPEELLIMDTDDILTAVNVIRMNRNGIGFSRNGYNGPFETAWTIDGGFVADFITAGEINGNLIKANSIEAAALTLEAKESMVATHNYLNTDIFTNIDRWEVWDPAPMPTYETIAFKTYLVFDGAAISAWDTNYRCFTQLLSLGDLKLNVHFKYHIDRDVTLTNSQRFLFVQYYRRSDEHSLISWKNMPAQEITADTDYTWDVTFDISDVSDSHIPSFGFYAIPGCKIYLEELTITSTVDQYATAGMEFNQAGFSMLAQRLDQDETHDYLPFDVSTNTNRWKPDADTGSFVISHETITVDGATKDAIVLDGTNATESSRQYSIETDIVGNPALTVQYKFKLASDHTPASSELLSRIYLYSSSWNALFTRYLNSGTTYEADTEYTYNVTNTPSQSADYFENKTLLQFYAYRGVKIYLYDIKVISTQEVYKKASLSFTTDGLNTVVQSGNVISQINQSAEQVSIKASKIDLSGNLTLTGDFTANSSTYSNVKAELKNGEFRILQNAQILANLQPVSAMGTLTGELEFYDDSGNQLGSINGKQIELDSAIFDTIAVNGFNGTSHFYREVQFHGNVYNDSGGVVFVSDRNKKKNIKDLAIDAARSFIMALKPRSFKFKKNEGGAQGKRLHHGFIAQEVKEAMDEDWGLYCEDQERDFIGLRYDEFIADMVAVIQSHEKKIQELENEIKELKGEKDDNTDL